MKLKGIILGRCPRCGEGHLFPSGLAGLFSINESCSVCGLRIMREPGYYLGAMYVSYVLNFFTVLPVACYLGIILRWPMGLVMLIALIQLLVSMTIFLRLSRAIWLYFDQQVDPQSRKGV